MARRLRSFRDQGCEWVMVGRVVNQRAIEKGCDFGYALAANSCEGVTGVDACTVTALGSITAFAASEPRRSSRNAVGFFGSGRPTGCPAGLDHPAYFAWLLLVASLFGRRREQSYRSNCDCQRRRLVQMLFIFVWESSYLNIRKQEASEAGLALFRANSHVFHRTTVRKPALSGEPHLPLDELSAFK